MNIKIRPATVEDRQALWQVHTSSIRQSAVSHYNTVQIEAWAGRLVADYYTPDPEVFIVAEADSAGIVGFGEISIQWAEITAVFVAPDYSRHGIGSRLLQALEEIAIRHGLTQLVLDASLNAVAFYENAGYRQETPTICTYGEDAVSVPGMLMTKHLF
ncbi:MAG: GNAT family N-acetyltransferase [Janthinobacterium lividum]